MRPPGLFAFLLGNNFSLVCALALCAYPCLILWHIHYVPGIVIYGCLGVVVIAWRARRSLGMHTLLHGNGALRGWSVVMTIGMWCGTALWAALHPRMQGTADYDLCFLWWALASLAMLLWGARLCLRGVRMFFGWVFRRLRTRETPAARPVHHIVTQALRVPSASPGKQQIIAALPEYAAKCLEQAQ